MKSKLKKLKIYTDGSASPNPGRGGIGAVIKDGDKVRKLYRGYMHSTNNRMEMMAIIACLELFTVPHHLVFYTDSRYVYDAINKGWLYLWKKRGWITSGGQPVKNIDLWKKLDSLKEKHEFRINWVRGHSGNKDNELADALAKMGQQRLKTELDLEYELLPYS